MRDLLHLSPLFRAFSAGPSLMKVFSEPPRDVETPVFGLLALNYSDCADPRPNRRLERPVLTKSVKNRPQRGSRQAGNPIFEFSAVNYCDCADPRPNRRLERPNLAKNVNTNLLQGRSTSFVFHFLSAFWLRIFQTGGLPGPIHFTCDLILNRSTFDEGGVGTCWCGVILGWGANLSVSLDHKRPSCEATSHVCGLDARAYVFRCFESPDC